MTDQATEAILLQIFIYADSLGKPVHIDPNFIEQYAKLN